MSEQSGLSADEKIDLLASDLGTLFARMIVQQEVTIYTLASVIKAAPEPVAAIDQIFSNLRSALAGHPALGGEPDPAARLTRFRTFGELDSLEAAIRLRVADAQRPQSKN